MKKLVSLLLVCLLTLPVTAMAADQYPVTWSQNLNGSDFDFSVDAAPAKAISMSQATTEMMLALGLADKMAGTAFLEEEIYEPLAEEYARVPVLAEKWPAYEVFMAAEPDFTTGWAVPSPSVPFLLRISQPRMCPSSYRSPCCAPTPRWTPCLMIY